MYCTFITDYSALQWQISLSHPSRREPPQARTMPVWEVGGSSTPKRELLSEMIIKFTPHRVFTSYECYKNTYVRSSCCNTPAFLTVAWLGFWCLWRVTTMATCNKNYELMKPQLVIKFPFILLDNSKFVELRKSIFLIYKIHYAILWTLPYRTETNF